MCETLRMTFNEQVIRKYIEHYKKSYFDNFRKMPESWWAYFEWLGSFTSANSFNPEEVDLAKNLLHATPYQDLLYSQFKSYLDPSILNGHGGRVRGICCECGKILDGYHVWMYVDKDKMYCDWCRTYDSHRVWT